MVGAVELRRLGPGDPDLCTSRDEGDIDLVPTPIVELCLASLAFVKRGKECKSPDTGADSAEGVALSEAAFPTCAERFEAVLFMTLGITSN